MVKFTQKLNDFKEILAATIMECHGSFLGKIWSNVMKAKLQRSF